MTDSIYTPKVAKKLNPAMIAAVHAKTSFVADLRISSAIFIDA